MVTDDPRNRSLLVTVSLMKCFSEGDSERDQMRKAREILDGVESEVELRMITLMATAIGTWGICRLVQLAIPGQDPEDWILAYVTRAFEFIGQRERGEAE